jgi:flagellar basal body-associated protein FliL
MVMMVMMMMMMVVMMVVVVMVIMVMMGISWPLATNSSVRNVKMLVCTNSSDRSFMFNDWD